MSFHNIKHFWVGFLDFKDIVNEEQFLILNFIMNIKISEFWGFAE